MVITQKISAPRLIYDNSSEIVFDEKGIPLPKSCRTHKRWFGVFYNYITIDDMKFRDVFMKSPTFNIDITPQLMPDKTLQPPCSLAREIDELKPVVKEFTESFLKRHKQYNEFRIYYEEIKS